MTEVSGLRGTGRTPRPLGDVKDETTYLQGPSCNVRPINHAEGYVSKRSSQKYQDMRDNLRHAALINIVAAVNENYNHENSGNKSTLTGIDGTSGPVSVLSNLVLPKDRTISIPTSPVHIDDPKFSQKKPVYFLHSGNEVPKPDVEENRKQGIVLSKTRTNVQGAGAGQTRNRDSVPATISPEGNRTRKDATSGGDKVNGSVAGKAKDSQTKKYFLTITKKNDNDKPATLAKCEAVDILDTTTDTLQHSQISSTVLDRQITPIGRHFARLNMYRAKSFPALFPVKRQKLNNASLSLRPVKVTGGTPDLLVGTNSNPNSPNVSPSPNGQMEDSVFDAVSYLNKIRTKTGFSSRREPISLEGRSLVSPATEISSNRSTPQSHRGIIKIPNDGHSKVLLRDRDIMKEIDDQFLELQKRIAMKLSSFGEGTSTSSVSQCDNFSTYGLTGRGFQTQSEASSKNGKREKKRVKFADLSDYDSNSKVGSDTKSVASSSLWEDNGKVVISVQGVGNKIHSPRKGVAFKPMSAGELARLKKRLLPNDYKDEEKSRYDVIGNMKISGVGQRENTHISTKSLPTKVDGKSVVSDTDTLSADIGPYEWNAKDVDFTDRNCVELPKGQGMSSFYPVPDNMFGYIPGGDGDQDFEEYNSDEDSEKSYRVLKAVDLQTLSGYQHRKFKKPEALPETTTSHFVKVKVK